MRTRLQDGIQKPKLHTLSNILFPATKHTEWRHAMTEEINALLKNHTWSWVPSSLSQNLVGCKWVFRIKRHSNGSIEHYKSRLVAKGFHQRPGIDYAETFSPVVKPAIIRIVLSLAVSHGWSLHQLDVKNAFLQEDVYMAQPLGFIDPIHPSYVCKLHKALYGLKQASHTVFLLLYVDDIVVAGSDSTHLQQFISLLGGHFDIKDLGPLSYFLGLQVLHKYGTLHINQLKYAHDLLHKANLLNSKPASTPLAAKVLLSISDGALISNPTEYRELFMSAPRTSHLVASKRILRYIKGTIDLGLTFTPQTAAASLSAYSDADWARCPNSRRSTTGYVITLGTNLISWCSKKQLTVSRSSTESEYCALSHACAETTWLCSLLHELCVRLRFPVQLFVTISVPCTWLPIQFSMPATRHIELTITLSMKRWLLEVI
ncbi:transposable element gene, partial [Prunus dulcis]